MAESPSGPRVLFVDQSGELGGAELSLLDIVVRRPPGDAIVLLAEGPFLDRLRGAGVAAEVAPLKTRVDKQAGVLQQLAAAKNVWRVARELARRARAFDLVYANTQKAAVVGAVAAKLAGRPFVWHLRDMLSAQHFSRANRFAVIGLTNRAASRVIGNSQATAGAYRSAGGRAPVSVVYNGIDAEPHDRAFGDRAAHRQRLRAALGLGEQPLVAVFGRLAPWKGQHAAIDAVKQMPGVHLLIVGDALFGEDGYAERVRALAEQDGVAGRVHLLGFRGDVPELMQAADVVLHCSTAPEPFGRVIVEGMLARRPVVAADAGGAAEIVTHQQTGLLTEPDAAGIAAAAARLLADPGGAERLVAAAYTDARRRFSIDDRVAEINAVIERAAR